MRFSSGDKLGPYEIVSLLGEGGMGDVWRARDPRLNREVAIKVSKEQFSDRFRREATTVASLNHPNICHLYDVGDNYLVMELVEGESPRGPMDVDAAIKIAGQVAAALDAAHEKGIVHRDLKPANIKVTPEGVAKVLDFGLAQAAEPEPTATNDSPTRIVSRTIAGTILGTVAYMAPEQARGKTVDKRADIWAFGVVLWELVTGRQLFEGETVSDVLASVLKQEPDLNAAPVTLRRLIAKCLEKDPKKRLRDIGDWEQLLLDERNTAVVAAPSARRATWLWPAVAALLAVAVAGWGWILWQHRTDPAAARAVILDLLPPVGEAFVPGRLLALSPDGRYLAFRTVNGHVGIRDLSNNTFRVLGGDRENSVAPFWSPDSRTVAYFSGSQLKRQDATGGPVSTICDCPAAVRRGGTWSPNGAVILFSAQGQILQVSSAGGTPMVVLSPDKASGEGAYDHPVFLPDGRHFLYRVVSSSASALYVGDLQTRQKTRLGNSDSASMYAAGYLLFARSGNLMAQAFDTDTLRLSGDAVAVVDGVTTVEANGEAAFGVSPTGVLAYFAGGDNNRFTVQLTWFDRSGMKLGTMGQPILTRSWAAISPDGSTVAFPNGSRDDRTEDIWLYNVARSTASRFTLGPGKRNYPVWSPNGDRLAYEFMESGSNPHSAIRALSGDKEEPLPTPTPAARMMPEDWSSDGRYLVERLVGGPNADDLWIRPMFGDRKPLPFAEGRYQERNSKLSPDSRWIAYSSNETGRFEVYVQSFPTPGHKMQISAEGGDRAVWSHDGKELYFITPDLKLMAAPVKSGETLEAGQPKALFETGIVTGTYSFNTRVDVTKDGRFLIPVELKDESARPLSIVLNWTTMLRR